MKVERCTVSDTDKILALENKTMSRPWTRDNIVSALTRGNAVFYKIEDGGKLMGYGGMETPDGVEASINNIIVDSSFRRRGVATAILNEIIDFCREHKIKSLWLEVWEGNTAARALYGKLGFEALYTRKNYYPEGDAIVMTLSLRVE